MNSYNKQALDIIAKEQGFIRDNLEKVMRLVEILNYYIHPTVIAVSGKPGTVAWMSTNAKKFQQLGAQCVISPVFGCWRPTLTVGVYKPYFTLSYHGEQLDYNRPYGLFAFQNAVELRGDWLFRGDFY